MDAGEINAQEALERDPRWVHVQRIAASPHFVKSARLIDFLRFVAKETLLGRGAQLNQQEIGVHVFNRRSDYDPLEDNIVRSHATRLRQRLDAYYSFEGKLDPVRISMVPGAYQLHFNDAEAEESKAAGPVSALEADAHPEARNLLRMSGNGLVWLLVLLLAVASSIAVYEWRTARQFAASRSVDQRSPSPVMQAFWSQVFSPQRRTLIVPGDSTLVLYKNITGKQVALRDYGNKSFLGTQSADARDPAAIAGIVADRRLTSIADLELTARLLHIPEAVHSMPEIRFARDLQLADLRESNVVFIGSQTANPWISIYQPQLNFEILDHLEIEPDSSHRFNHVVNRAPRSGEQKNYPADAGPGNGRAYGVIAMVPSLDGKGVVLVVEGTSIAGTEAASEFVTDGQLMESVLLPLYRKYNRIPAFEILLETADLNGTAPKARLLAMREYQ